MNDPNTYQHGGDHYKRAGLQWQHWDLVAAMGGGWDYYLGCATKYLSRVKDGEIDSKKALHYVDKLLSLALEDRVARVYQSTQALRKNIDTVAFRKQVDVDEYLSKYFEANTITAGSEQAVAIAMLVKARTMDDLLAARVAVAHFAGVP